MRVLQIHNRYRSASPSGENGVVDREAEALRSRGHLVERFERFNDEIDTWPKPKKALLPGRLFWSQQSYREVRGLLQDSRPDVVHVHNLFPLLSISVLRACERERVPVVATLHNYRLACPSGQLFRNGSVCHACVDRVPAPAVYHGCYRGALASLPVAAEVHAHRSAWRSLIAAYICISEAQRQILAPVRLPPTRVFVKWNLVPIPIADEYVRATANTRIVMFAGRLDASKGIPVLLKAWDHHRATTGANSLQLVIAGSGPLEQHVVRWATGRADVQVLGLLSPIECRALMRKASAVVVPSAWEEPFGLVAVEAMAAGVPVLAPAHGAFPELVRDGVDGRLYPPGDTTALADFLADLEDFPERYQSLGRNGQAGYQARFHPETITDRLLSIYDFAVRNPVWNGDL